MMKKILIENKKQSNNTNSISLKTTAAATRLKKAKIRMLLVSLAEINAIFMSTYMMLIQIEDILLEMLSLAQLRLEVTFQN